MADSVQKLKELAPRHEFFVGIDSDGCVFDTMEIKQKECFAPQFTTTCEDSYSIPFSARSKAASASRNSGIPLLGVYFVSPPLRASMAAPLMWSGVS